MRLTLNIELKSDATFGRGDGVAGLVDTEIEHNPETGLPIIHGRTIKGLLVEECANILYAAGNGAASSTAALEVAAGFLFGSPGSADSCRAQMRIGTASLPAAFCSAVANDVRNATLTATEVLESLTTIRRQTAVNEETGAPEKNSLRSQRAVLRKTKLEAPLEFDENPSPGALALLEACVAGVRRGGLNRNRGRGLLRVWLSDDTGGQERDTRRTDFESLLKAEA